MRNFIALALLLQTSMTAFAGTLDVVPAKFKIGSTYVRVTKMPKDRVRFEECIKGLEAKTCRTLGPQNSYSMKTLLTLRKNENLEATGTIAADIVLIAGAAYAGASLLAIGSAKAATGSAIADAVSSAVFTLTGGFGAGVGASAAILTANCIDALNPVLQVKQAQTLNTEVIEDKLVVNKNIEEYIENLETVLNKIK